MPSLGQVDGRDIRDVLAAMSREFADWSNAHSYVIDGADMRQLQTEIELIEDWVAALGQDDIYWFTRNIHHILNELVPYDPYPETPPICKYLKRIQ